MLFPQYYYSIKAISIGGRCLCNGFADKCLEVDGDASNYKCECQHFTCGASCDSCCPGYVQKKWRPRHGNDQFVCERKSSFDLYVEVERVTSTGKDNLYIYNFIVSACKQKSVCPL